MITSYGYGTLRLKEGPNQPGPLCSQWWSHQGEGLTGLSVVQIRVCRGILGVGSPVGVSVGDARGEGLCHGY